MSQQIALLEDLVRDILVRLPVKSLARFKSVCNSWLGTISDPDFTRDHLDHVYSQLKDDGDYLNDHDIIKHNTLITADSSYRVVYQERRCKLRPKKRRRRSKFVSNKAYSEAETIDVLDDQLPNLFPNDQPDRFIPKHFVRSSCDGLVLITVHPEDAFPELDDPAHPEDASPELDDYHEEEDYWEMGDDYRDQEEEYLLIYNPTTRECKRVGVPPPSCYYLDAWGIGYDHISQSYKVVRAPPSGVGTPVQVLSLKTDSWKTTTPFDDIVYRIQQDFKPVTANRCPHWAVIKTKTDDQLIIYFDPSEEIFKVMPPPPSTEAKDFLSGPADRGNGWDLQIFEVRGGLGLCMNKAREELSLWWMKEHGVTESWTKLYNVCKTPTSKVFFTKPWFLTKRGKLLFVWNDDTFYSYDPGSHTVKALPRLDHIGQRNILTYWYWTSLPTPYIETLVSPFTT
ncbi:hypothetical protein Tsubulata_036200 [Turnera subulata]|uniref:F-box domain-containing protein n=1 Tax=Turnera subulata TaxID=218843 RepID=A0A9Q0G8E7_9ROSI|nr:hypothetical protein Tsubulata_036200 [Turnera subulata]